MRFFILKRKVRLHTQKKKNTHTHTLRALALSTHLLSSSSSSSKERDHPLRSPRGALITSVEKSRVSREKRDVSFFLLLVNFCCVIREKGKRDLKNAFHVGAQPVV